MSRSSGGGIASSRMLWLTAIAAAVFVAGIVIGATGQVTVTGGSTCKPSQSAVLTDG